MRCGGMCADDAHFVHGVLQPMHLYASTQQVADNMCTTRLRITNMCITTLHTTILCTTTSLLITTHHPQSPPPPHTALVSMLTRIATLVTAFDQVESDQDAMRSAAQKFQSILEVGGYPGGGGWCT